MLSRARAPRTSARCPRRGLYDVCLSLHLDEAVVGNDVDADGKALVMITGANQGGKSTFLRSVGLAQLMMQCGMFVAAESFRASVCDGVFTHFKREEDATMKSGKLDEELGRMSEIADAHRAPLAAAVQRVLRRDQRARGLGDRAARSCARCSTRRSGSSSSPTSSTSRTASTQQARQAALFLRAERRADGRRTFRLVEGEPLPTSYGEDLYRRIFGADPVTPPTRAGIAPRARPAGAHDHRQRLAAALIDCERGPVVAA